MVAQPDEDDQPNGRTTQDEKRNLVSADFGYRFTRSISARVFGRVEDIQYQFGREDQRYSLGVSANFQVLKYGSISAGFDSERRESNETSSYTNNALFVGFQLQYPWSPGRPGLGVLDFDRSSRGVLDESY